MPKKKKRLIPAYAGSTSSSYWASWLAQAHPRLRGEHSTSRTASGWGSGSSPLTRGARRCCRGGGGELGLIPAYAGSTSPTTTKWPSIGAHPRLRGEHGYKYRPNMTSNGSSPLTRGALHRAGWVQPHRWAHPRLRGEHSVAFSVPFDQYGSSPLTRGAPGLFHWWGGSAGLIPAYAGSTLGVVSGVHWLGAHPRLRGEHEARPSLTRPGKGSSPLTRGAPLHRRIRGRGVRLIPAYAGSTLADMHVSEPKVDFRSDLVERRTSSVDCDERYEQCSIRCAAETLTARLAAA